MSHECTIDCERTPTCTVCKNPKKPIGRDMRDSAGWCSYDCPGYITDEMPGHLWKGELEATR